MMNDCIDSGAWDLEIKAEVAAMIEPRFVLIRDEFKDILRRGTEAESDSFSLDLDIQFTGGDEVKYILDSLPKRTDCDSLFTGLLDDCSAWLRRAMEALEYFDLASADYDATDIWIQSIHANPGTHHSRTLDAIVALAATCIDCASRQNCMLARCQVEYWKTVNYPVFRRLVCFALTRPNLFSPLETLDYVLADVSVAWSHTCARELCAVLAYLWPLLNPQQSSSLTKMILSGPPAQVYPDHISNEDLEEISTDAIYERLLAIESNGGQLLPDAVTFMDEVKGTQPSRRMDPSPQDAILVNFPPSDSAQLLRNGFPVRSRQLFKAMAGNDVQRLAENARYPASYFGSAELACGCLGPSALPRCGPYQ